MIMSQAFHGFCYAFFFAAAYVYVDKIAEEDVRILHKQFWNYYFGRWPSNRRMAVRIFAK